MHLDIDWSRQAVHRMYTEPLTSAFTKNKYGMLTDRIDHAEAKKHAAQL